MQGKIWFSSFLIKIFEIELAVEAYPPIYVLSN